MNPFNHEEQALLYHYGELSAAGRAEFERHLNSCPQCRQTLAALSAVGKVCSQTPAVPPELVAEVKKRVLPGRIGAWLYGHPWFRYSTAAVGLAAGLLVFSGIELGNRSGLPVAGRTAPALSWDADTRADEVAAGIAAVRRGEYPAEYEQSYYSYLEENDTDGFFTSTEAMYYGSSEADAAGQLMSSISDIKQDIKTERTLK